jgi:hypothetical protein
MFGTDTVRRWAQAHPQLATALVTMAFFAAFAGATGDVTNVGEFANMGGDGPGISGGTMTHQGP